jgi:hypothetical protein
MSEVADPAHAGLEIEQRVLDLFAKESKQEFLTDRPMDFEFMYHIEDGLLARDLGLSRRRPSTAPGMGRFALNSGHSVTHSWRLVLGSLISCVKASLWSSAGSQITASAENEGPPPLARSQGSCASLSITPWAPQGRGTS